MRGYSSTILGILHITSFRIDAQSDLTEGLKKIKCKDIRMENSKEMRRGGRQGGRTQTCKRPRLDL
jgi:hypothetical protein